MYKPSPRWREKDTIEERTPREREARSWLDPNNPTKGRPVNQKGIHPEAATKPQRSRTTPRRGSIGIDFWHAVEFSRIERAPPQAFQLSVGACPSYGLVLRTVVPVSPPYLTRVEGTGTGQASACPVRSVPCGVGRGPTLADPVGRLTGPIGAGNPRDRTRCCEVGHPRDRPPRGVRSSLAG
jgi:hypothetical protein